MSLGIPFQKGILAIKLNFSWNSTTLPPFWSVAVAVAAQQIRFSNTMFLSGCKELPVNVKFVIEGMEETGSNGLDAMILAQRDTFFSDVDYIIISDCGWLSRRPALTYGTRGNCYFYAEVV